MWDLYAGDGVEKIMGFSLVPCKEGYLGPDVQLGVESAEDVATLISLLLIYNISSSSSDWVLQKDNEIQ